MTVLVRRPTVVCSSPVADDLRALYAMLAPTTIGCLFVEDLVQVPLDEFLRGGSRVLVVDWWRSRPHQAVASSVVRQEAGEYVCRICERGDSVCRSFTAAPAPGQRGCASFVLVDGAPPRCARFEPGPEPMVLVADGAMGRAACFAMRLEEIVAHASSANEALGLALAECRRCSDVDLPIDVASGSVELAITVLSPARLGEPSFNHMRDLLRRRFGTADEAKNAPVLERVRAALFRMQVEGHLRELHRLVDKSKGHVYLATEPAAPTAQRDHWALTPGAPLLFELIDRYFTFDFGRLPPASFLRRASTSDGRAQLVQAALLTPRKRPLPLRQPWSAQDPQGGEP